MASFIKPPCFGVAALAAWPARVVASAVVSPRAAARPMKSRRLMVLLAKSACRCEISVVCLLMKI